VSLTPASGPAGAPVVTQASEPAWVRKGTAATQQDYATALGFERVLVEQLTKSMAATAGLGGESSEEGGSEGETSGSAAGSGEISTMLPQALATGVMNAGGLGLASQITRDMQAVAPATPNSKSGGTAA
jgi:Rod binding domain-containing protein